ncbi:hypothetical protein PoMZ_01937 [Pyricularia oryzae]|uniref:Uncharacterized protein n=1 Tax=Pyricularia oryzae TaxID=318829 RepID=A0A4P7N3G8_PYROR|nr:hypothetical protein PoMZ_01937 [Pyricularia oryzae]
MSSSSSWIASSSTDSSSSMIHVPICAQLDSLPPDDVVTRLGCNDVQWRHDAKVSAEAGFDVVHRIFLAAQHVERMTKVAANMLVGAEAAVRTSTFSSAPFLISDNLICQVDDGPELWMRAAKALPYIIMVWGRRLGGPFANCAIDSVARSNCSHSVSHASLASMSDENRSGMGS